MSARPDPFSIRLRPMQDEDLTDVVNNELASYSHPWSPGIFRDCLRIGYACWVAEDATGVIGHLVLSVAAGEAHLLNLCVHPSRQRCGIGRRMLRHALQLAREYHAERLFLEVRPSNTPAIALYDSSGFERIGVRRGYYPVDGEQREDAIVFSTVL